VRYAHTFGLPPGEVVRAFGLGDTMREAGRYGARLRAQQLERVSTATRIDCDHLQAMVLARFVGRAFPQTSILAPSAVPTEARAHELTWRSRFCPQCLREHGAWLLRWQLSWSVACTRHELLLARRCRSCGAIPRIGAHATWPRDHAGELSDPTRCWHRRNASYAAPH
jgi:TniQ protein